LFGLLVIAQGKNVKHPRNNFVSETNLNSHLSFDRIDIHQILFDWQAVGGRFLSELVDNK